MNCSKCTLMFNRNRPRYLYTCGYAFCVSCLSTLPYSFEKQFRDCPIYAHQRCVLIWREQQKFNRVVVDKKIKIVILGLRQTGKTTLANALLSQTAKPTPLKTLTPNFQTCRREFGNLLFEYLIWDTVHLSTIFLTDQFETLEPGYKNSDFQKVVYQGRRDFPLKKLELFVGKVVEETPRSKIIVVNNLTAKADEQTWIQLENYTKIHGFAYFEMDCRNAEEVKPLWRYIEENSVSLKPSISKLRGSIVIIKKPTFKPSSKKKTCCRL